MFKSLKKKIATGEEGVSPGRQTPLSSRSAERSARPSSSSKRNQVERKVSDPLSKDENTQANTPPQSSEKEPSRKTSPHHVLARVQHLLEVGKAQAENNGILDSNEKPSDTSFDPLGVIGNESFASSTADDHTNQRYNAATTEERPLSRQSSVPSTPKSSRMHFESPSFSQSSPVHDRSDLDIDVDSGIRLDNVSHEDLAHMFKKQEKTLNRYKLRFTEVVDAYKGVQKEKEKLENTLTSGQDKQLRRIAELKETVELEQQAKRHMEEAMRLSLEEKGELIKVLQTKVDLLKSQPLNMSVSSTDATDMVGEDQLDSDRKVNQSDEKLRDMEKLVDKQSSEIDKYKSQIKDAHEIIIRLENEKKIALQEIMENMQKLIAEKNELRAEVIVQKDEIASRNETINALKKGQEGMKQKIEKELKGHILEEAILRQEKEMQVIFQKKEDDMKVTFAEKVKEFQRLVAQKQETVRIREEEINKLKAQAVDLESALKEYSESEVTLKTKIQSVIKERGEWENKYYDANTKLKEEEAKMIEVVQQHNRQLKSKQDEHQQQVTKMKKANQAKSSELQESIKQHEAKVIEMEARFVKDMENKKKENESQKHVEISKAVKKYEVKLTDLKKIIKELRKDVSEKEGMIQSLESKVSELDTKGTDAESIVGEFETRINELNKKIEAKDAELKDRDEEMKKLLNDSDVQLKKLRDEYEADIERQNKEVSEMKNGLTNWETALKELEIKYKSSEEELEELKKLNSNYKDRNEQLEKAAKESETELKQVNEEADGLKVKLDETVAEYDEKLCCMTRKYEEDLNNFQRTKEFELEASVNLNESFDAAQDEIQKLREEKDALEQIHRKAIEEITDRCESNEEMAEQLRHEKAILEDRLQKMIDSANTNEQDLTNQIAELGLQVSDARNGMVEVSRRLDEKIKDNEQLEKMLGDIQSGKLASDEAIGKEIELKRAEVNELRSQLENERRQKAEGEQMLELNSREHASEIEKLREELDAAKISKGTCVTELDEKVKHAELEKCKLAGQLEELNRKLESMESDLISREDNYRMEIENLKQNSKDEIDGVLENKFMEINTFKTKLNDLEKEKNDQIDVLEGHLKTTENKLLKAEKMLEESRLEFTKNEKELKIQLERKLSEINQKSSEGRIQLEDTMKACKENHAKELERIASETKKNHEDLQRKYKKILADKEKKHAAVLEKLNKANEDRIKETITEHEYKLTENEETFKMKLEEAQNSLKEAVRKISHLEERIHSSEKQSEDEIKHYKEKEAEARVRTNECQLKIQNIEQQYQEKISALEKELMSAKASSEEMKVKLAAGETTSRGIDAQLHELVEQKRQMEEKVILLQKEFATKRKELENAVEDEKKKWRELMDAKEEEMMEKTKKHEKSLETSLENQEKDLVDQNRTKLLEMKKKAETKIGNLKKQHGQLIEQKDRKISELIEAVEELRQNLDAMNVTNEKRTVELNANYENDLKAKLGELSEERSIEMKSLKHSLSLKEGELEELKQRVEELEDKIQMKTVEKMEALKSQKEDLMEENEASLKKIEKVMNKKMEDMQLKFDAQIDDKEYEYSARVKQVIKEFQAKLSEKDQENDQNLDETIERLQKDEQKLTQHYEEQICEFKRELKLRDDEMGSLKKDTEYKLSNMEQAMKEKAMKHEEEFLNLERDYDKRVREMIKTHEEQLENLTSGGKVQNSEHENEIRDLERQHAQRITEMEEQHAKEKTNVEKRLKTQMKKNQSEMKKLLAGKVAMTTGKANREDEDWELMNHLANSTNSGASDNETDSTGVESLKAKIDMLNAELTAFKERERSLKMQLDNSPRNGRPTSLNISGNLNTSASGLSSPATPEPIEYEYLKNILYQYMMGKQRKQMAKVLAAIVHFTPSQTKHVIEKEEQAEYASEKSKSWI